MTLVCYSKIKRVSPKKLSSSWSIDAHESCVVIDDGDYADHSDGYTAHSIEF